jgi:activator of HSP90 ATPase
MLTITRRQLALGGFALAGVRAGAQVKTPVGGSVGTAKTIHMEEEFKGTPQRVYEALLDARKFHELSGMSATIDRQPGGVFTVFDGHILGRNIELVADRRIVQAWRTEDWTEGLYSIARFQLEARGSGTRVVFDHTGFPSDLAEHLAEGWRDHYWAGLRKYLS